MKLTKKENPFDVQPKQKWKSKDGRRQRKFTVVQIEKCLNGIFAVVDYGDTHRMISLLRFDRYVRCK